MLKITSNFTEDLKKIPGAFLIAIDPGLKGGCILFCPNLKKMVCFELPIKNYLNQKNIDLNKLKENILLFIKDFSNQPIGFLIIEKPFKRSKESVLTFGTSIKMIGKILGLFELLNFNVFYYSVTPKEWTSFFDKQFINNYVLKDQKKLARAKSLMKIFSFKYENFFTPRKRLKDGVSDAAAILIWTLLRGKIETFNLL